MKTQVEVENLKEFNEKTFADQAELKDKNIHCIDCGQDFVWTVGERIWWPAKAAR